MVKGNANPNKTVTAQKQKKVGIVTSGKCLRWIKEVSIGYVLFEMSQVNK